VKKVCANTKQIDASIKSTVQGYVVFASPESVDKALQKNNILFPGSQNRIRVDRVDATLDSSRSVFVGNLPYEADENSLRLHFCQRLREPDNVIENVRIVRDPATLQCKGFGYILFKDKSLVASALQKLHETPYKKRCIRVTVCGKRFKGRRGAMTEKETSGKKRASTDAVGALKRLLSKEKKGAIGDRRKRGDKKSPVSTASSSAKKQRTVKKGPAGMSKRQAAEAKVEKRVKKLQKRAAKGMGKMRRDKKIGIML
jgi:nucleolar protein 12